MDKIGASLSPPRRSNLLVGLIIFFSATQLGLHFWPLSSLVYGVRIDYLSPTLYLFDLLLLSYLIARRSVLKRNSWLQAKKGSAAAERTDLSGTFSVILSILLTNLLFSANPLATLSWSLHFLLYFWFLRTVLDRRPEQSSSRDAEGGRTVLNGILRLALPLTLLFQLALSITQVSLGHSLGGLFYWLGERSVAVGSPAVALATFMGQVVLRAYGTFGHPNVLAGWSVLVLLIIIHFSGPDLLPRTVLKRNSWLQAKKGSAAAERTVLMGIPLLLTSLIVFLTQSRAAAISLFAIIIPLFIIKKLKFKLVYFVLLLSTIYYLQSPLTPPRSDLSLSQRLILQGLSLSVIRAFPIFGTGAQSSISTYPTISPATRLLQPDHNSFTLFLSWFGLFGVSVFIYYFRICLGFRISNFGFILPLLPLLLLDHYLLTSPQGLFILLLYLKVCNFDKLKIQ